MGETLIIFSRYPEPGKTKTRMIPALGASGAAELQRKMTEHTLKTAVSLASQRKIQIEIHFAGKNISAMKDWLGAEQQYIPQANGDLGHKMRSSFQLAFDQGQERVVTIGIDCPDITPEILVEAFASLQESDLTLGPAQDGGYYLIGLNSVVPEIFQNIDWGTGQVMVQTEQIASQLALKVHRLPTLADIDRPEDLARWQKYQSSTI